MKSLKKLCITGVSMLSLLSVQAQSQHTWKLTFDENKLECEPFKSRSVSPGKIILHALCDDGIGEGYSTFDLKVDQDGHNLFYSGNFIFLSNRTLKFKVTAEQDLLYRSISGKMSLASTGETVTFHGHAFNGHAFNS